MTLQEYIEKCKNEIFSYLDDALSVAYRTGYKDGYNDSPTTAIRRGNERRAHNGLSFDDSIKCLNLPKYIYSRFGDITIGELCSKSKAEVLQRRQMGEKKLKELLNILHKYKFKLTDE